MVIIDTRYALQGYLMNHDKGYAWSDISVFNNLSTARKERAKLLYFMREYPGGYRWKKLRVVRIEYSEIL